MAALPPFSHLHIPPRSSNVIFFCGSVEDVLLLTLVFRISFVALATNLAHNLLFVCVCLPVLCLRVGVCMLLSWHRVWPLQGHEARVCQCRPRACRLWSELWCLWVAFQYSVCHHTVICLVDSATALFWLLLQLYYKYIQSLSLLLGSILCFLQTGLLLSLPYITVKTFLLLSLPYITVKTVLLLSLPYITVKTVLLLSLPYITVKTVLLLISESCRFILYFFLLDSSHLGSCWLYSRDWPWNTIWGQRIPDHQVLPQWTRDIRWVHVWPYSSWHHPLLEEVRIFPRRTFRLWCLVCLSWSLSSCLSLVSSCLSPVSSGGDKCSCGPCWVIPNGNWHVVNAFVYVQLP